MQNVGKKVGQPGAGGAFSDLISLFLFSHFFFGDRLELCVCLFCAPAGVRVFEERVQCARVSAICVVYVDCCTRVGVGVASERDFSFLD